MQNMKKLNQINNFRNVYKSSKILIVASIFILSSLNSQVLRADDDINVAKSLSRAFEKVVEKITPSLVHVNPIKKIDVQANPLMSLPEGHPFREFFGDQFGNPRGMPRSDNGAKKGRKSFKEQQGLGTGFIIDREGHIITNNHVVSGADEVTVTLADKRKLPASIVGVDPYSDLAILKVNAENLTPVVLGDSDALKIGEWIIAAGNPFGFDNSYTAGIVSAKGRSLMHGTQYEDYIQTDAAINPGNSGGPLVNLTGEVVGINTAIFTRSGGNMGLGFAIPVNMAKSIKQSLITEGKVTRGWLGVAIQDLNSELAESFNYEGSKGALVGDLTPDSPAAKAGLMSGDILTYFDGKEIENVNRLRHMVAMTKPNSNIPVKFWRAGKVKEAYIKIGELSPEEKEEVKEEPEYAEDLGLRVSDLNSELQRQFNIDRKTGAVVVEVEPYGLAGQVGIQEADVILSVGDKNINKASEFYDAVKNANLKKGIRLIVETQGMKRFVFIKEE
jgi:serine protease Do